MKRAFRVFAIACALAVIGGLLSLGWSVISSSDLGFPQANTASFTNGLGLVACAGLIAVAAFNKLVSWN